MSRHRDITVDRLKVRWDDDGSVVSPRLAERPRPFAHEVGRVLLALAGLDDDAEEREPASRPCRSAITRPLTAVDLVRLTGLDEREARAALRNLLPTGCVLSQQIPTGRHGNAPRSAHGYFLAPEDQIRGRGRRPRLSQLALLLEPNAACGDLLDVLLRKVGMVAVQARNAVEAHGLLRRIGFDLIAADVVAATAPPGWAALAQAARAAGCGPLLALTCPHCVANQGVRASNTPAVVKKPFTPTGFEAALAKLGVGSAMAFPAAVD